MPALEKMPEFEGWLGWCQTGGGRAQGRVGRRGAQQRARPRAGWLAVRPAMVGGGAGRRSPEVGKKADVS
jgi:hypothetical protein